MGQKAKRLYSIKNKEETNKKYLIGWGHIDNLVSGKKAQSWLGVWGLADGINCISVKWSIYRDMSII